MKRWGLAIALLLSLGVNVGVLLTLALGGGLGGDGDPFEGPPRGPEGVRERPWDRGGPPPEMERFVDRLGLEGEGRERFVELQRDFLRTAFEARRRRMELQRELRRELTAPEPDREKAERLVEEMAKTFHALETRMVRTVLESRALLDEEQERRYLHMMGRLRSRLERFDRGPVDPGPGRRR